MGCGDLLVPFRPGLVVIVLPFLRGFRMEKGHKSCVIERMDGWRTVPFVVCSFHEVVAK